MTKYNELKGDPTEYNPSTEDGEHTTEDVPIPGSGQQSTMLLSHDSRVQWSDGELWFDCPCCGDRLCSTWFLHSGASCDGCGSDVQIAITVTEAGSDD